MIGVVRENFDSDRQRAYLKNIAGSEVGFEVRVGETLITVYPNIEMSDDKCTV